jgi:guanylate kinase
MIILVGASASGKTEIKKQLVKNYHYEQCITTTTRPKRAHEIDGVDYHFLSEEDFINLKTNDMFLETTLYQSYLYGTQKKDLKVNAIIVLDPFGANKLFQMKSLKPFIVYIDAAKALRKQRMLERGDEPLIVEKRLIFDQKTFQKDNFNHFHLYIKNENKPMTSITKYIDEQYQDYLKEIEDHI